MPKINVSPEGALDICYKLSGNASRDEKWDYREVVKPWCRWRHADRTYIGNLDEFPNIVKSSIQRKLFLEPQEGLLDALLSRVSALHKEAKLLDVALRSSDLFPFQRDGVAFLAGQSNAGLFDEMGLGKTVQALMAIPNIGKLCTPTIVVSPASVKGIWQKEITKWRPDIKNVYIVSGREGFFPPSPGEVVICNYAILPDAEDCMHLEEELYPGTILIGDEIHKAKNSKANRTKSFRRLRRLVNDNAGSVWGLTGTPLLNNGGELREVCKSIGIFTRAYRDEKAFDMLFENKNPDRYSTKHIPDFYAPFPEVAKRLSLVSLRRERKEVLPQLPSKLYREIQADPPDGEAARICDEALGDELVLEALRILEEGGESSFGGMGALMEARKCLAICKIPALLELVDEYEDNETPLVVFSAHRMPIDILKKREGWIVITGSTNPMKRAQIETDFQAGKYKGIAGTIRAMSEGLTLTYAHHAAFVDLDWTPAQNNQAEDRVCRIGQDRGVNIIRLVADHDLDRMITDLLVRKAEAFDKAISLAAKFNREQEIDAPTGDASPLMRKAAALQEVINMIEGIAIDTTATEIIPRLKLPASGDRDCGTSIPTAT